MNGADATAAILFFILLITTSLIPSNIEYRDGDNISENCEAIKATVIEKGSIGDVFDIDYLLLDGTITDSKGSVTETKIILYVSPITFSQYNVGDVFSRIICEGRTAQLLEILLNEDWAHLY